MEEWCGRSGVEGWCGRMVWEEWCGRSGVEGWCGRSGVEGWCGGMVWKDGVEGWCRGRGHLDVILRGVENEAGKVDVEAASIGVQIAVGGKAVFVL